MKNPGFTACFSLFVLLGCSLTDIQAPVVNVNLSNNQRVETSFVLSGTVMDFGSDVESVFLSLDNGPFTNISGTLNITAKTPVYWSTNIVNLEEGSQLKIAYFSRDTSGNSTRTNIILLNVGFKETEPNSSPSSANLLEINSYRWGIINKKDDADYYAVNLASNQSYSFYTTNRTDWSTNNTVLTLYDTNGTSVITADDNSGLYGLFSLISSYPCSHSGKYYIKVEGEPRAGSEYSVLSVENGKNPAK